MWYIRPELHEFMLATAALGNKIKRVRCTICFTSIKVIYVKNRDRLMQGVVRHYC